MPISTTTMTASQQKGFIKKVIQDLKAGKAAEPNDSTCSTCNARSRCISCSETPQGGSGAIARAVYVCASGHTTATTDTRFSLQQDCNCNIIVHPVVAHLTPEQMETCLQLVSSSLRLLIVTGFGQFNTSNSEYYAKLVPLLQGIPFDVVQADNGHALTKRIMSKKYSAVMFLHLDDKGFERNMAMFGGDNLYTFYQWISFGGKFILHGEGDYVAQLLQTFVGKPWHFCGDFYRRVKHACNRKYFCHFPLRSTSRSSTGAGAGAGAADSDDDEDSEDDAAAAAAIEGGGADVSKTETEITASGTVGRLILPKKINMKATTLSGVAVEDRLYSPEPGARCISAVPGFGGHVVNPERTGIAFTPKGKGFVCYVGDVNAEAKTLKTILALLQLP